MCLLCRYYDYSLWSPDDGLGSFHLPVSEQSYRPLVTSEHNPSVIGQMLGNVEVGEESVIVIGCQ